MEIFMRNAFYTCFMTLFFSFQAFHAEAVKTTEGYLSNRIDLNDKKYPTFFSALELLTEKKAKIIVETQASGNFTKEGYSTIIFADWASQNGAHPSILSGIPHQRSKLLKIQHWSLGLKLLLLATMSSHI